MIALSLLYLLLTVVLPGAGITIAISFFTKKKFDLPEFLAIASASSLFAVPSIALISIKTLPYSFAGAPLYIIGFISLFFVIKEWPRLLTSYTLVRRDMVFLGSVIVMGAIIWTITHAYYPLPDLDPYYWIDTYYRLLLSFQSRVYSNEYRSGFFAFIFTWNTISKIDLYAFFKYVIPCLYVGTLIPLWMIFRRIQGNLYTGALFTAFLWSSSTILYATTPMPQVFYIIALSYFVSFLVYARISGQKFYLYAALVTLLFCVPIYESAALPLLIGVTILLYNIRATLLKRARQNLLATALALTLLITNIPFASSQITFVSYWIYRAGIQALELTPNFLFPASYVNVDGNQVGWKGVTGVVKYYLYYAGPVTLVLSLIGIYVLLHPRYRKKLVQEIIEHPESTIITGVFLLFFSISEVLPRLISLALLPDRAWISTGISLAYPGILLLVSLPASKGKKLAWIFITLTFVSVAGALYINYQKRFLIPSYQLNSASWITMNLPTNRVLISDANTNLLRFHAASQVAVVSPLYCNKEFTDSTRLLAALPRIEKLPQKNDAIDQFLQRIQEYILTHQNIIPGDIAALTAQYADQLSGESTQATLHPYIYYYADDPENPYITRPYVKARETCSSFVFDENPSQYKRIYEDGSRVIIWQVL